MDLEPKYLYIYVPRHGTQAVWSRMQVQRSLTVLIDIVREDSEFKRWDYKIFRLWDGGYTELSRREIDSMADSVTAWFSGKSR